MKRYKKLALESLSGNWGRELSIGLIYFLIFVVANMIGGDNQPLSILISLLLMPLSMGYNKHFLDIANKKEAVKIGDLFYFYTNYEFLGLFALSLVVGILTIAWSLLFIIPGIIASISYTLAYYIKIENKDMDIMEAINLSKKMMNGHKMEYFLLSLSFIGWGLLATITIIGLVPFTIYMGVTLAYFYNNIRDNYEF